MSSSTPTSTRPSKNRRVLLWVVLQALSLVSVSSFSPLVVTMGTGRDNGASRGRISKESRPSFSSSSSKSKANRNRNVLQSQSGQAMSSSTPKKQQLGSYLGRLMTVKKVLPFFAGLALYKTVPRADVTTRVLGSVNALFVHFPYVAAFMICGFKAALADGIVQKSTIKKEAGVSNDSNDKNNLSFEFKRNIAFLFYGGLYQGCFQEFMFNTIFPLLFGTGTDLLTVITKVSFDMLVVSPFLCLPVAYVLKGAIYKDSITNSIKRYIYDVKENKLLKKYWMLWSPAQCLTFSLIPEHFRIGFIAGISFFWLMILSAISGKKVAKA